MAVAQSGRDTRITNPMLVKLGHWYTTCCHRDLQRIKTRSELADVRAIMIDDDSGTIDVWTNRTEALLQLREWIQDSQEYSDVTAIDVMLREEK